MLLNMTFIVCFILLSVIMLGVVIGRAMGLLQMISKYKRSSLFFRITNALEKNVFLQNFFFFDADDEAK
jgi:hypothetical protein